MKVQKVTIKEFKKLKDINADIQGRNVLLVGDNDLGKTSFIQLIEIALGKNKNIPPNVLGEGEVVIDKDGVQYTLKVKIKEGKASVTILGPDGMKDDRKGTLYALIGAIDFDVDEFVEESKSKSGRKDQLKTFKEKFLSSETLQEIVRHETNNDIKFKERTEINGNIKNLSAEIAAHPLTNHDLTKFVQVDITAVYEDLKKATDNNANVARIEDAVKVKKEQLEDLKKQVQTVEDEISKGNQWLAKNKAIDIKGFEETIQGANESNTKYTQAQDLIKKNSRLKEMQDESADLTVLIETGRQAIADAIRDMDSPVEGLSFDEEQLLWNGIPVNPDSLSTSQIMELGIRLRHAENPTSPIFIQGTESFGEKKWNVVLDFAKENNLQIIGEKVERGKEELCIEIMEG